MIIVLAGHPDWGGQAVNQLVAAGFQVMAWETDSDAETYIRWLTDLVPALILVDGDDPGWPGWVTTAKVQQATLRIPILVAASDPLIERQASQNGADGFVRVTDLETQLLPLVEKMARRMAPEQIEALTCSCAQDLPPRAREAVAQFNAGEYYHQHDLFEAEWMEESGPIRELYRAVLQVGVAYYHITQGNTRGALRMLQRSVQWLAILPDVCQGIDVRQLREDAAHVRIALETSGTYDPALLPPLRLVND